MLINQQTLSGLLSQRLTQDLGIPAASVLGFHHDRASVNGAAFRLLQSSMYSAARDIPCFSHPLNNAGTPLQLTGVSSLMSGWKILMSRSNRARLLFTDITEATPIRYS